MNSRLSKSSFNLSGNERIPHSATTFKKNNNAGVTPVRRKASIKHFFASKLGGNSSKSTLNLVSRMADREGSICSETSSTTSSDIKSYSSSSAISSYNNFRATDRNDKQLQKAKQISYSVFDLRDLSVNGVNDWTKISSEIQEEIKDRRHDMYITEIELDSLLQTGPTLR